MQPTNSISIAAARAPYVVFEYKPVEDRAASLAAGVYTAKDVAFAIVTPAGSKDRYEHEVEPWFKNLEQQVREGRFPQEWLTHYQNAFRAWKANEALPEVGVPIKNWGVLSPAQRQTMLAWGVTTVEALASANEELIGRLGMGARALVQRAKDFLDARDGNKTVMQLEGLRTESATMAERVRQLEEQNKNLTDLVKQLRSGKPETERQREPVTEGGDDGFMKDI